MTLAGRLQQVQELFDAGMLCACPLIEAWGDDPFTGGKKYVQWIAHLEECEGHAKVKELLKLESIPLPTSGARIPKNWL